MVCGALLLTACEQRRGGPAQSERRNGTADTAGPLLSESIAEGGMRAIDSSDSVDAHHLPQETSGLMPSEAYARSFCTDLAWYLVYDTIVSVNDSLTGVVGGSAARAFAPYGAGIDALAAFEGAGLPAARYSTFRLGAEDSLTLSRACTRCGCAVVMRDTDGYSGHTFTCDHADVALEQSQVDSLRALLNPSDWPQITVEVTDLSHVVLLGSCLSAEQVAAAKRIADSLGIPSRALELVYLELDL